MALLALRLAQRIDFRNQMRKVANRQSQTMALRKDGRSEMMEKKKLNGMMRRSVVVITRLSESGCVIHATKSIANERFNS